MSTSKLLLVIAAACLAQTTRAAAVDCASAAAKTCESCLPCVTRPFVFGTKTTDGKDCVTGDTCKDCLEYRVCQDCKADATTLLGKYNAGCAKECLPCTIVPNDGKTDSGALCKDTCDVCVEYGLQCVATGCDAKSDYYKKCDTECTQCIGEGVTTTKSGKSCDTCNVCEPLAKCVGSESEYQTGYSKFCDSTEAKACDRCLPCVTLPFTAGTTDCSTCDQCTKYNMCQDCDAVATTPVGKYNAGCATECLPCTLVPNDGKTASKASCDTCSVCLEYGLQCVAAGCDANSDYYKKCETECTQCIGGDGDDKTASGASCSTCEVCEPLIKCAGSQTAVKAAEKGVKLVKAAVPATTGVVTTAGATIVCASLVTVGAAAVAWVV